MAREVKYKTIEIEESFKDNYLMDYSNSLDELPTVNEKKRIGSPFMKGSKVRVIVDPLTYSKDGKWIQAMDENGTVGFIRAQYINLNKLEQVKEETLPQYTYAISNAARILYEEKNGIRKYSQTQLDAANKTWAKERMETATFLEDYDRFDIPYSYDENTGLIHTNLNVREMRTYGLKHYCMEPKDYIILSGNHCFRNDDEDKGNFVAANRIYAERIARERARYKRAQEIIQERQTSFEIPKTLINEASAINSNENLKKINKSEPVWKNAWTEKLKLEAAVETAKHAVKIGEEYSASESHKEQTRKDYQTLQDKYNRVKPELE